MSDHGHDHHHHPHAHNRRRLAVVMALTVAYMLAEAVGGFLTNSLALLSDAGHMLADVASLGLAWLALWFTARPITPKKTYGYYRIEILAALANGVALIVISLLIAYEAMHRLRHPEAVAGFEMLLIAAGGLLVNAFSAWLLHGASEENLNMRGAFLHITGDALGSVGAIIAGLLIWRWGWTLADPIISFVVCALIVFSSWHLIHASVNILLEGTPPHINVRSVVEAMHAVKGVADVHELHIWTISSGKEALSAHVTLAAGAAHRATLEALQAQLRAQFNITHVTIQIELPDEDEAASSRLYQIVRKAQRD
jgi:cobalt-zinc-cadmium efflux system protein